jgi:ribonuclease HII
MSKSTKNDYSHILNRVHNTDKEYIIGIDEVGYGCIAGPLYVCAFSASKNWNLKGLDDSKELSEKEREDICAHLENEHFCFSIAIVHPNNMDEYKEYGTNVHGALKYLYWKSAQKTLEVSKNNSSLIVLDGNIKFPEYPYTLSESLSLPKADGLIPHVMAASVIAKVHRDNYMKQLHKKYPQYAWEDNKGYPAPAHLAALKEHGYCDLHRVGYEPIKSMIKNEKM